MNNGVQTASETSGDGIVTANRRPREGSETLCEDARGFDLGMAVHRHD